MAVHAPVEEAPLKAIDQRRRVFHHFPAGDGLGRRDELEAVGVAAKIARNPIRQDRHGR